ncbi:MAG: hypothetical protein K8L99_14540 [Anaerolineae bacterium]|nr:hypothetical protein [Anaerolineae bacterium]
MPFENETEAMTIALDTLGPSLFCLPDGEIGEKTAEYPSGKRAAWVMTAIDLCSQDTDNWEVVKGSIRDEKGFPVDYEHVQRLRPKHSPATMHDHLDFGYHNYFNQSYSIFKQLREEHKLQDLKFQVGVPTGLGITISMLPPVQAFRYADAFNKRIAYEVNEILKVAGDDVIIQIEVPAEVALAYRLPPALLGLALRSIYGLVNKINPGAQIGFHLCLGDLNNQALTQAQTLDKMVAFSNKLVQQWPSTHHLVYMHYPLAEAATPPPTDKSYYTPLKQITLPEQVRFVGGFVHEKHSLDESHQILEVIEKLRGTPIDVACSCGLGRRPASVAQDLLKVMSQLAE